MESTPQTSLKLSIHCLIKNDVAQLCRNLSAHPLFGGTPTLLRRCEGGIELGDGVQIRFSLMCVEWPQLRSDETFADWFGDDTVIFTGDFIRLGLWANNSKYWTRDRKQALLRLIE